MALHFSLKQPLFSSASVGHRALHTALGGQFAVGEAGPLGVWQEYDGEDNLAGRELKLYRATPDAPLGRGFMLAVSPDGKEYTFTMGLPTTAHDLRALQTAVQSVAEALGARTVVQDGGAKWKPENLGNAFAHIGESNAKGIPAIMARQDATFALQGVKWPLYFEREMQQTLAALPPNAAQEAFDTYLHQKQVGDYYYAKPRFYSKNNADDGGVLGNYSITEGVHSIIPKKPFIHFWADVKADTPISRWMVGLVGTPAGGGPLGVLGYVSYSTFLASIPTEDLAPFDENHYLVRGRTAAEMQALAQKAEAL